MVDLKQEDIWFLELTKDREDSAKTLKKPSMRQIMSNVVDVYSDQAHFIYELLQNADDAGATFARFILRDEELLFIHNGKKPFSISNPDTEDIDGENGKLGDINAICSIGNSNKNAQDNEHKTIGKFGIGFKAVFQYTMTPHIYASNVKFKITDYFVPIKLDGDHKGRKSDETLFVFPFNHSEKTPKMAFDDISEKLKGLTFPVLFLVNLEEIEFECPEKSGGYRKNIEKTFAFEDASVKLLHHIHNDGDSERKDGVLMFSRRMPDGGHNYSVVFFLDNDGMLRKVDYKAFCFFPTKESTKLNFVIHAPFLLTNNRANIKAVDQHNHNKRMIKLLSTLSADSLCYLKKIGEEQNVKLINDNIVNIIPYDAKEFHVNNENENISFEPFYSAIKEKFQTEEILPTRDGYTSKENAYWQSDADMHNLFSDEQLASIVNNPNAKWVFTSEHRNHYTKSGKSDSPILVYIDEITCQYIDYKTIINCITGSFIEKQPFAWLYKFYEWIYENSERRQMAKTKPIFLDQDGKSVVAFKGKDDPKPQLFLPTDTGGYLTINNELWEYVKNKHKVDDGDGAYKLIHIEYKIVKPELKHEIEHKILPLYKDESQNISDEDKERHFKKFFMRYVGCPQAEIDTFIQSIKSIPCIPCFANGNQQTTYYDMADKLYFPDKELLKWFKYKPDARFVHIGSCKADVDKDHEKALNDFLMSLGVADKPRIIPRTLTCSDRYNVKPVELTQEEAKNWQRDWSSRVGVCGYMRLPIEDSTWGHKWIEKSIDGCSALISNIVTTSDKNLSVEFLKMLLLDKFEITTMYSHGWRCGKYSYYYRTNQGDRYDSSEVNRLRFEPWLLNDNDEFVSADKLTTQSLSPRYDIDIANGNTKNLLDILNIKDAVVVETPVEKDPYANLTPEQRSKIELANKFEELGIRDENDLEEFKKWREEKKRQENHIVTERTGLPSSGGIQAGGSQVGQGSDDVAVATDIDDIGDETFRHIFKDIVARAAVSRQKRQQLVAEFVEDIPSNAPDDTDNDDDSDWDGYDDTKPPIDYNKQVERAKMRSADEINNIKIIEKWTLMAARSSKYTFGWFKALLELEALNGDKHSSSNREIKISFARVEPDPVIPRALLLKHPNRYIPPSMDEIENINLELYFNNGRDPRKVAIEVASVKSYTLQVKLKSQADINDIDLECVAEARIVAKSPTFLLENLKKSFGELPYDDSFNMRDELCENIEFVFGPPGTGKTTYLAENVIIPIMQVHDGCKKILVLTPTNKAADVLVNRIMNIMGDDKSYMNWLVRFGTTNDDDIEKSGVYRDKTFDIRKFDCCVTITTIARFPYDYIMPANESKVLLNEIEWDYIIFDEASMIPLADIIYPLYKMRVSEKFIIAGDPFQIKPIITVDTWKDENIYTMVNLRKFVECPDTIPHRYNVKLLKRQYRSVPKIGEVFSKFMYNGILDHNRFAESQRTLGISGIDVKALNVIKFPVSKYESIYRAKKLNKESSYHPYVAILTFELVKYLAKEIRNARGEERFSIGIIAPYRAQADLIDKLMASVTNDLPKSIEVQVGTIHGFQGDECDIIVSVFNPSPSRPNPNMFLNKDNIINVSISRARDYLFIVMPEDIDDLKRIKDVEDICRDEGYTSFSASEIEKIIFGDEKFIENNSFSTNHQSVNVYQKLEQRYEVRCDDAAVDVQVHVADQ